MSKATAAAPPSTANEVPIDRPPRRQSPPTFDCRAATIKPQTTPLRDNHAPSIMPPPRRRIPILIVAAFSSRSPRDSAGQPLSHEKADIPGADAVRYAEGHTKGRAIASSPPTRRGRRPWHVQTLFVREPGGLVGDQGGMPRLVRIGKAMSRSR